MRDCEDQSVRTVRWVTAAPFMVFAASLGGIDFGYERGWGWLVCLRHTAKAARLQNIELAHASPDAPREVRQATIFSAKHKCVNAADRAKLNAMPFFVSTFLFLIKRLETKK